MTSNHNDKGFYVTYAQIALGYFAVFGKPQPVNNSFEASLQTIIDKIGYEETKKFIPNINQDSYLRGLSLEECAAEANANR